VATVERNLARGMAELFAFVIMGRVDLTNVLDIIGTLGE